MRAERPGSEATLVSGRLRISTASCPTSEWLHEHWDFGHDLPVVREPVIWVEEVTHLGPASGGAALVATGEHGSLRWTGAGDDWQGGAPGGSVHLSLAGARPTIRVTAPPREAEPHWFALQLALTEALRTLGYLPLHAAVIARRGAGTALAGASGAGKSTTAMAAARSGWSVVAEDLAWVDVESMTAHRWDRGVRLRPDSIRLGMAIDPGTAPRDDADKQLLAYDRLAGPDTRSVTLTHLASLGPWSHGDTERAPLAPRERVRALWEATGAPFTARGRDAASVSVQRLLDRLTFQWIRVGRDTPF